MIRKYQPSFSVHQIVRAVKHTMKQRNNEIRDSAWFKSGSDALCYFLKSQNINGKILTPAYTCERVINALTSANCEPLFYDVDYQTASTPTEIALEQNKIKAIIITQMFGLYINADKLIERARALGIPIIEDRALVAPEPPSDRKFLPDAIISSFGKGKLFNLGFAGKLFTPSQNILPSRKEKHGVFKCVLQLLTSTKHIAYAKDYISFIFRKTISRPPRRAGYCHIRGEMLSLQSNHFLDILLNIVDTDRHKHETKSLKQNYLDRIQENEKIFIPRGVHRTTEISAFLPIYCTSNRTSLISKLYSRNIYLSYFFDYSAGDLYSEKRYPISSQISTQIILLPLHRGVSVEDVELISNTINEWSSNKD